MTAPVMTTPAELIPLGATRDAAHVYGWNPGPRVFYPIPSVTTVLKAIDKSGPLVGWAKRETARCAVENLEMVARMVESGGKQSAIDWLKKIPDYQRETSADLGSRIHVLVEKIARGEEPLVTAEELPFVTAYREFVARYRPAFLAAEEMAFSLRWDYAGTLDAVAVIDGETWLLDWKTGSGIYPETGLQLAAYANADFIGRTGTAKKFRIPKASRYGVVHIRPEGARLIEYRVTPATFKAFLYARRMHEWLEGEAKQIMGAAIEPRGEQAA